MNSKNAKRLGGFLFAAFWHAVTIAALSVVVRTVIMEEPPIPEPTRIEIGEQTMLPPETSPVPEVADLPPEGEPIDVPDEADDVTHPHDEAMLQDPDEQIPEEITEASRRGLPGQPNKTELTSGMKNVLKGPHEVGTPKAFGVPIEGDTVFLLDVSGSMGDKEGGRTRLARVLAELSVAIESLRETDSFDIVAYSGILAPPHTVSWNGSLRKAVGSAKAEAIAWLDRLRPDGGTPTMDALLYVCETYPVSLDNLVLVTDGMPDSGTEGIIIASIGRWMSAFDKAHLVCVAVGEGGMPFIKRLVAAVNGVYAKAK